jgi:hypothetical protein
MKRILVGVVGAALSLFAAVRAVDAAGTRAEQCAAAELRAAAKKVAAKLRCHEKAFAQGKPVPSACLAGANARFAVAFAKVEARGCATADDLAEIEDRVDGFIAGLLDRVREGAKRTAP